MDRLEKRKGPSSHIGVDYFKIRGHYSYISRENGKCTLHDKPFVESICSRFNIKTAWVVLSVLKSEQKQNVETTLRPVTEKEKEQLCDRHPHLIRTCEACGKTIPPFCEHAAYQFPGGEIKYYCSAECAEQFKKEAKNRKDCGLIP